MASLLVLASGVAGAADLLLGPSDVLKISVYNNPDLSVDTRVSESGFITFPLIGQVAVAGLPTAAAEKKIAALLESGGYVKKAQVNIIVTLLQSQQVSVLGQVNRPGRYPIDASRNLMDVLALAGGVNPDGGDIVSLIRKRNGSVTKDVIDVVDMVRTGNLKSDFELSGNDVVFVERAPHFFIYGEVQRPGMFRLERSMTVLQALAAGGGLTPRGTERGLRIKRRDADGKLQEIDAKYDDLVQIDDVLYVRESLF
jgi:polysaccharide export outer membrane protein